MVNKYTLRDNLIHVLNHDKDIITSSAFPSDELHTYIDGCIPIYYTDMLELARSDHETFCFVEDIGLLGTNPGVFDIITAATYEYLSEVAQEWLASVTESAAPENASK